MEASSAYSPPLKVTNGFKCVERYISYVPSLCPNVTLHHQSCLPRPASLSHRLSNLPCGMLCFFCWFLHFPSLSPSVLSYACHTVIAVAYQPVAPAPAILPPSTPAYHRAFGLARLPCYFGSDWVRHRTTFAVDLQAIRCPPPLQLRLAPPTPSVSPAQPLPSRSLLPPRAVVITAPSQPPRSSGSLRFIDSPNKWWAPPPM